MSITLSELRTQSRQLADMENSSFVSDSELNVYINYAVARLHDLLIQAYGADYFLKDASFSSVSSQQDYALSTIISAGDFYKIKGLDVYVSGKWRNVDKFNWNERNTMSDGDILSNYDTLRLKYRVIGDNLKLIPTSTSINSFKIWYIPKATKLVSDSDSLNDYNQYADYIVISAAIKMLQKEESSTTLLREMKREIERKIEESAANRDAQVENSISDVNKDYIDYSELS